LAVHPMNELEPHPPQGPIDVLQLARAMRFALVFLVVGLSYFSVRASLAIGNFAAIFRDMLGNRPLPPFTIFVLGFRDEFIAVSIFVPLAVIGTLFSRRFVWSFYIIGTLGIITLVEFIILYHGLSAPLGEIITSMGGQADGGK
jgi:hypothetical protein